MHRTAPADADPPRADGADAGSPGADADPADAGSDVDVQPVDVDGVRTVAVLTVLWAVAFVLLALRADTLEAEGRGWWLWACLAGVGLGLLGLEYTRKRRDAIQEALEDAEAADHAEDADHAGDADAAEAADVPEDDDRPVQVHDAQDDGPSAMPPSMQQSSPNAVTRPIDTGAGLEPVSRQDTDAGRRLDQQPDQSSQQQPDQASQQRPDRSPEQQPPRQRPEPGQPAGQPSARGSRPSWPAGGAATAEWRAFDDLMGQQPGDSGTDGSRGGSRSGRDQVAADGSDTPAASAGPTAAAESTRAPEPTPTPQPEPAPEPTAAPEDTGVVDDDEPLLDTTLGSRRARRPEDVTDESDETTAGGGRQYRGRRARRSDSA